MSSFEEKWRKAVVDMKDAIESDNNILDYLLNFEPNETEGYSFTTDPVYKRYSDYLDNKTGRIHSGASFACCVRESVEQIKNEYIFVEAEEVTVIDEAVKIIN